MRNIWGTKARRLGAVVIAVTLSACERPATVEERAAILASIDSTVAGVDSSLQVYRGDAVVSGETVSVTFDVSCTDEKAPRASLLVLSRHDREAFVRTVNASITTRVIAHVDTFPARDDRWIVDDMSRIVAYSPTPVMLGREMLGARRMTLTFWPNGGDSTTVVIDLTKAQGRLRGAAAACRWPA